MGHTSAVAVREYLAESAALEWHLTHNHYPPLPASILPVAKRCLKVARDAAANGEQIKWDRRVRLPEGCTYRGSRLAPVVECMKAWHLWDFVYPGDDVEDQFDDDDDSTEEYGDE